MSGSVGSSSSSLFTPVGVSSGFPLLSSPGVAVASPEGFVVPPLSSVGEGVSVRAPSSLPPESVAVAAALPGLSPPSPGLGFSVVDEEVPGFVLVTMGVS